MPELGTIAINKGAELALQPLGDGQSVAVVDDFLVEPERLRAYAAQRAREFYLPPKSYPGVVLDLDAEPMADIYRFVRSTLSRRFGFLRGDLRFSAMLSMTTLQPEELSSLQRLCHSDPPAAANRRNFAAVLYLFDDERLGGTGFYRWKEQTAITEATALEMQNPAQALAYLKQRFPTYNKPPCYMTESTEIAERIAAFPAKLNRLIFYSGDIPHSAQIAAPERLTTDISNGRLTLNCFVSAHPGRELR